MKRGLCDRLWDLVSSSSTLYRFTSHPRNFQAYNDVLLGVHDVRCKVDVCGEIGRTELQNLNAEQKIVWNQTFKLCVKWRER